MTLGGLDAGRAYAAAWRWGRRVPEPLVRAVTVAAADVVWLRHGGGVRRLESNLAKARPDLDAPAVRRLSRAGMRSYLRYFGEAFTLSGRSREQIEARVSVGHRERVQRYLDEGRQVVLALGHLGNWDLAGAWAARELATVTTVAERLKPEEVYQEFLRFREGIGLRIIPLSGGGDVFRQLVRVVRTGPGVMPLLADRDLTSQGVEVDLLGHRARVAVGPAALGVTAGAPVLVATITYERLHGERRRTARSPWGIHIDFIEVPPPPAGLPVRERIRLMSQAWVDVLGEAIRRHPEDWHMLQRVFVEDLDPERYAATVAEQAAP
ncbi:MAG TPA: phosphatidylinositol mannoside acyltransferase [Cellulomonas sp.]